MKFLKISQSNCRPCAEINLFLEHNLTGQRKTITSLDQVTESNVLYEAMADEHPEIAAHYQLGSVPAIIRFEDNGEVIDTTYGVDKAFLEKLVDTLN